MYRAHLAERARSLSSRIGAARRPQMSCVEARGLLPAASDGFDGLPAAFSSHVGECLYCQAELASYHRLYRLCRELQATETLLPPGLLTDVLKALGEKASKRALSSLLDGRRLAYLPAAVVAVGLAAALVTWSIVRPRRAPEAAT